MKKSKFFSSVLVLFILCAAFGTFAQKPTTEIEILHWPGAWFYNECADEVIRGDLDFRIMKQFNKEGELVTEHWSLAGGVLIGQVTGKIYRPAGANHWNYDHNADRGAETYSERWIIHAVAPGTQIKFYIKIHWTVNEMGETTAYFDKNTWGSCK